MKVTQAVLRALRVFRSLADAQHGLTLQELSDELDIPVGSMHRLLAVLAEERFVGRSPTNRRYFLGPAVLELSTGTNGLGAGLRAPHRALAAAAAESGETVFTTQLVGDRAICVDMVEARHPLRLFVHVGQEMPLHAAASARAVLADLSDTHIRRLLEARPLVTYTDGTPTTVEEVMHHVLLVRKRGYDTCADELDQHVWAVAVPVRNSAGRVCASVTLAAPVERFAAAPAREQALRTVQTAAAAMSSDLGFEHRRRDRRARLPKGNGPPAGA